MTEVFIIWKPVQWYSNVSIVDFKQANSSWLIPVYGPNTWSKSGIHYIPIFDSWMGSYKRITFNLVLQYLGLGGRGYLGSAQKFSKQIFLAWKYLFQVMINSFRVNDWFLYPPENVRKPLAYVSFSGGTLEHWPKMG